MKTICIKSSMLIIYLIMNSLKKLQHHLQIWLCAVLKRQLYIVFVGDTKPNQQHSCPEKPTSGAQKSAFEWTRYTQEGVRVVGTRWSLNSLSTQTILILWWFCKLSAMCYIYKHETDLANATMPRLPLPLTIHSLQREKSLWQRVAQNLPCSLTAFPGLFLCSSFSYTSVKDARVS